MSILSLFQAPPWELSGKHPPDRDYRITLKAFHFTLDMRWLKQATVPNWYSRPAWLTTIQAPHHYALPMAMPLQAKCTFVFLEPLDFGCVFETLLKLWSKCAQRKNNPLKGRYLFGYCQRPVFSLGVSTYNHKITSLWKFGLNSSSKLRENDERKNALVGRICVLSDRN